MKSIASECYLLNALVLKPGKLKQYVSAAPHYSTYIYQCVRSSNGWWLGSVYNKITHISLTQTLILCVHHLIERLSFRAVWHIKFTQSKKIFIQTRCAHCQRQILAHLEPTAYVQISNRYICDNKIHPHAHIWCASNDYRHI